MFRRGILKLFVFIMASFIVLCGGSCSIIWYLETPRSVPNPPEGAVQDNYYQSSGSGGSNDFYHYTVLQPIAQVEVYYGAQMKRFCTHDQFQFVDRDGHREASCAIPARFIYEQQFYVELERVSENETKIFAWNSWASE